VYTVMTEAGKRIDIRKISAVVSQDESRRVVMVTMHGREMDQASATHLLLLAIGCLDHEIAVMGQGPIRYIPPDRMVMFKEAEVTRAHASYAKAVVAEHSVAESIWLCREAFAIDVIKHNNPTAAICVFNHNTQGDVL